MNTGASGAPKWDQPQFSDDGFRLLDNSDLTKKLRYQLSGISTGTTRVHTVPNRNFQAVEHPVVGTTTPTAVAGQLFYDTADGELYTYDGTRAKWLSTNTDSAYYGISSNGTADASLPVMDGIPIVGVGNLAGEWALHDGTITGAWVACKDSS